MSVTLEIPEDVSRAISLPPAGLEPRLRLELAVSFYAQEILSLGKAAEWAGLSRPELNDVLAKRGVPMHYSEEDLAEDIAYARNCQ